MTKSIMESVAIQRARKGSASGIDEGGAYWTVVRTQIEDRYNQHTGERVRHDLAADQYRSGRVAVRLHGRFDMRDIPVNNWVIDIDGAENCTTIEELACLIEGVLQQGNAGEGRKSALSRLGRWGRQQLREVFPGLPEAHPAPDEGAA